MHTFVTDDGPHAISGIRDVLYGVGAEQIPEGMWDPDALSGQTVLLNGREVAVASVETYRIPRSPERPYQQPFGLLVTATR